MVFITAMSGGFVAGLKAGFAYNTFPLMAGQWVPDNLLLLKPVWHNFFESVVTVQFQHRVLAISLLILILVFWLLSLKYKLAGRLKLGVHLVLLMILLQVALGISTLLLKVPVPFAAAHQAGMVLLFTAMLYVTHQMYQHRPQESVHA
jgi:cytochrome c oxidase assembly protein subunit 15